MSDTELAIAFRDAVLGIVSKDGQPATLGTAGGTVYYNDGVNDHLDRVWARMGAEQQVLVVAKVGKKGIPNTPGLEVNISKRHGSLYVDDWASSSGIGSSTPGGGISGHTHDYTTRNVKVSQFAGIPTGDDNVVVGYAAGDNLGADADQNTLVGAYAGESAASDIGHTLVGYKTGGGAGAFSPSASYGGLNQISANTDMSTAHGWGTWSDPKIIAVLSATKVVLVHVGYEDDWTIEACVADISGDTITEGSWYTLDASYDEVNNPSQAATIEFDSTHFLYAWFQHPGSTPYTLKAVAGSVSGTTISVGAQSAPSSPFTANNTTDISVCRLSDTKAVIIAQKSSGSGSAWVVSVSGTTLTWSNAYEYIATGYRATVEALSDTKIVVFYGATGAEVYAKIGTVSGTTISFGSAYQVSVGVNSSSDLSCTTLSDSLVIFAWEELDTPTRYKYLRAASITGTVPTMGTPVTVGGTTTSSTRLNSLDRMSSSAFIYRYEINGAGDDGEMRICTVAGTTITLGAQSDSSFITTDGQVRYLGGGAAILYSTDTGDDTMQAEIISGLAAASTGFNTFIGANAGEDNTGSYGVCIGTEAGKDETSDYRLYIDISDTAAPLIYGEFDDDNIGFNTVDMASGTGVIAIANATAVPSATPTGGGVLYVEGGALKYKGSSGTITTLGVA